MNGHARRRAGATSKQAISTNLSDCVFGDHAHIHQGDQNIYVKYWASSPGSEPSSAVRAQLEAKEKDDCRRSLSFRDMDARVQNISPTQPGTCEWFFETSKFQQWYSPNKHDDELLWIKGNPGTGKSTLMKRVLNYCQTKDDYSIAAYFFNARGTELEKTPLGMLRSLLFQLLAHEPSLYNPLLPIFLKKQKEYGSGNWEWREPELKSFLLSEISKCQSRPPLLIIDALDECSDRDVQNVAEFLQHLSTNAMDAGIALNICLSSRHYPFVRFKRMKALKERSKKKACGIFMWVVLVITILNRAYDDGKIDAMNQKLSEIPADLGEVFETLLNRNNPDKDEAILILQCVLFAKQLLKPEELYFALIAGTKDQKLGKWDPSQVTPDIIRRRIISSSRGLVEIRRGVRETVQFIHGSVNDFLVRNSRLQTLDPGLASDPIAKSHNRLKDCCMSYIMMESLELPKNSQDVKNIASSYPFLQYASRHLFDHAEEATLTGQKELLRTLKDEGVFKRVERLHSRFVSYGECGRRLNLLHILAACGLHKLVATLLEEGADINAHGRPHGTALEAAIENRHYGTVETLLNKGAKIDARGRLTHSTALQKAIYTRNTEILALLIERGAKLNIWEKFRKSSVLHEAISNGNRNAIAMLLDKGANINARGPMGTALQIAAAKGERDIVKMLLEKEAKVNIRGLMGTALRAAAFNGNKEIVEMLLEKGAKVNIQGLMGTALQAAASGGEKEIVGMLLDKGADVNARGGFIGTVLQAAASRGEKEVVKMLLDNGADVNAWGGLFGAALSAAANAGNKEIVEILLDYGANINAGRLGVLGSALQAAAINGKREVMEMLLDRGAKINAWGGLYSTALQAAAARGREEVVEMLLNRGAKVDTWGWLYGNALQAAICYDRRDIVEMLIEKGAKETSWRGVFPIYDFLRGCYEHEWRQG